MGGRAIKTPLASSCQPKSSRGCSNYIINDMLRVVVYRSHYLKYVVCCTLIHRQSTKQFADSILKFKAFYMFYYLNQTEFYSNWFCKYVFPAYIGNYTRYNVWDEIIYPVSNYTVCAICLYYSVSLKSDISSSVGRLSAEGIWSYNHSSIHKGGSLYNDVVRNDPLRGPIVTIVAKTISVP